MKISLYIITVCGLLGPINPAKGDPLIKHASVVDIGAVSPEDFDWNSYIKKAQSTVDERDRAYSGLKLLYPRLEALLAQMKAKLVKNGGDVKEFEKLHKQWKSTSDFEVSLVAKSYGGTGSQRFPAIAKARLRTVLFRIRYLKNFEAESGLFNQ